jgi:hypothetical protein
MIFVLGFSGIQLSDCPELFAKVLGSRTKILSVHFSDSQSLTQTRLWFANWIRLGSAFGRANQEFSSEWATCAFLLNSKRFSIPSLEELERWEDGQVSKISRNFQNLCSFFFKKCFLGDYTKIMIILWNFKNFKNFVKFLNLGYLSSSLASADLGSATQQKKPNYNRTKCWVFWIPQQPTVFLKNVLILVGFFATLLNFCWV